MKDYVLQYHTPAADSAKGWEEEALPIGNSYMGGVIFGGVSIDRVQLNEKTLWKGGPSKSRQNYTGGNIKGKYTIMHEAQTALAQGKTKKAAALAAKLVGEEDGYGAYQNLGDYYAVFNHKNYSNYSRNLNISDATARVEYANGEINYQREYLASFPAHAIAIRYTADKKSSLSAEFYAKIAHECDLNIESNQLIYSGNLKDNDLYFECRIAVSNSGGTLSIKGDRIAVDGADEITVYITAGTDYTQIYPAYRGEKPTEKLKNIINMLQKSGYSLILAEHKADFGSLMSRCIVDLGGRIEQNYDTEKLLESYNKNTADKASERYIEELIFQYGRYLLIASSRGDTLPANLQGVWNSSNNPPWGSDYHVNVNLQLNYSHAYAANLAECAEPLIDWLNAQVIPGRITAECYHNIVSDKQNPASGWVLHTQCTPFGWTCPGWNFYWGWSPAATAWILQNAYDYYRYTLDIDYLKAKVYPMMKEHSRFWLRNLIWSDKQQRYVSSPTFSPEHGPITAGNTYEQSLIWQLFNDTAEAAIALGDEESFIAELEEYKELLKPAQIGKWGQLKEWYEEDSWLARGKFKGVQKKHRHCSHLLGCYPGSLIEKSDTALNNAVITSLLDRGISTRDTIGSTATGWSKSIKACTWARVGDGNNAYKQARSILTYNTYKNLWTFHPPFQIDANFGISNAVCEMLVFTGRTGVVELLPAIPAEWAIRGSVKGIRAKGGYTLDFAWENGKVTTLSAASISGKNIRIALNNAIDKSVIIAASNIEFVKI